MTHPAHGTDPLVSVLMLTHNHEAFLQQAIASVQAQTLQSWELLIGEDASADGTADRARAAARDDPRIRVLTSPEGRLGFHRNFARLLAAARAPLVAFLEGDDWWSEPRKLEWQLECMQHDPSLAFCGGRTRVLDQRPAGNGAERWIGPAAGCTRLGFADLIPGYGFHFSSVMMRRSAVQLPGWIFQHYCLDRPLYLLAAMHGDAGVIDAELSVYRLHGGGVWAPLTPLQQAQRSTRLFSEFCRRFPPLHRRAFRLSLSHILWSYLAEAMRRGRRGEAMRIFCLGVTAAPGHRLFASPRITLGVLLRLSGVLPMQRAGDGGIS